MRYTSIDPATRYIAGSTGKRCLGILCKCLPRERERESFLTARLSFAQRTRGGTDRKKSSVPLESIRTVAAAPRWREDSCRKQRRAEKKKGRKKLGGKEGQRTKGRGTRDEWARRGGERGCVRLDDPDGAHNLPIGTLHYSCLQLRTANQPLLLPPPSCYLPRSNSVAAPRWF